MDTNDMYLDTQDLYEDEFNEEEYADGFMDGYEEALDAYGDEESFLFNIGEGGGKAGRKARRAARKEKAAQRIAAKRAAGKKPITIFRGKDVLAKAKDIANQPSAQAPVESTEAEAPKADNTMLYVGIAIAVVVVAVAVWYFKFRKK